MFSDVGFIKLVILTGILEAFYCNSYNKLTGTKTKKRKAKISRRPGL
jgi:hypothetical protein